MPVDDQDMAALVALLSPERLAVLLRLTGKQAEAIDLHQETLRVGAGLMTVIASIEIALRNAVCANLDQHFGGSGWLLSPPLPFQWRDEEQKKITLAHDSARRAAYSKLTQAEKHSLDAGAFPGGRPAHLSHLKRAKGRRTQLLVSDGKIIAELTFYIWKRLYSPDYEHALWKPTLRKVFPHRQVKRAHVAQNLEVLYQARNRLAHHEPVLHRRFAETVAAVDYIAAHLHADPPNAQTPLAKLIADDLEHVRARAAALHARLDSYRR